MKGQLFKAAARDEERAMATSAVVTFFYCHECKARFCLPAPSSMFDFTLCPRCRTCYLDDAPFPHPDRLMTSLPPPPPPPWLSDSPPYSMTRPPPQPVCSAPPSAMLLLPPPSCSSSPPSSAYSSTRSSPLRTPHPLYDFDLQPEFASAPIDPSDSFVSISGEERSTPPPPPRVSTYGSTTLNGPLIQRWGVRPEAAEPEAIAALPTVTVDSDDAALVCVICTDPILPPSARRLPCDHLYHSTCIVTWMSLRNSCPVCRRALPSSLPHPQQTEAPDRSRRRRSLVHIRRICRRLLRSMEISRGRRNDVHV